VIAQYDSGSVRKSASGPDDRAELLVGPIVDFAGEIVGKCFGQNVAKNVINPEADHTPRVIVKDNR